MNRSIFIFVALSILFFDCSNKPSLEGEWEVVEIGHLKLFEACFKEVEKGSQFRISSNTLYLDSYKEIAINLESFDTDSTLDFAGDTPWGCRFKMIEYSGEMMVFDLAIPLLPLPNTFAPTNDPHWPVIDETSTENKSEREFLFKLKRSD